MKTFIPFAFLAAAALMLGGCAALEGQDLSDELVSNEGVTAIANSRLNDDFLTGRDTLSVRVGDGLATLYGTVPDEATRQRAIQILENSPGVFEVLDRTRRR